VSLVLPAEIETGEEALQRAFHDVPAPMLARALPLRLIEQNVRVAHVAEIKRGIEHRHTPQLA